MAQLSILEKRLLKIEMRFRSMGASASPAAAKNMAALSVATRSAGNSATVAQGKFASFFTQIKAQGASFVTVLARRFAFMAAAMIELFAFAFVIAIPAAIAKSIQAGAAFEDAMLRTATVASGGLEQLQENYALLSGAAREMAIKVAFSATEVADAMFEMVSSGITTTDTIAAMPAVLNFAGAAMTNLTISVDIMTQVMKSFGKEASDLDDIADILITALNLTTLNVQRLQAAFRFAAPAGAAFKQTVEDTVITMSLFVDATKQGGIAGRAFRFMMSSLAAPSSKAQAIFGTLVSRLDGTRVAMSEIALEQEDGKKRSIITILRTLANTTISSGQVLEAFGTRSGPIVALALVRLRASMEASTEETGKFTDMFSKMQDAMEEGKSLNIAARQYSRFMQSLSNQFKLLGAIAEEAMIKISTRISPTVTGILKFFQTILKSNAVISAFMAVAKDMGTALLFLATVALVKGTVAMALWIKSMITSAIVTATAGAANLGLAATIKAVAFSVPGLLALLYVLFSVFQDIEAETGGLSKTLEGLGRWFRNTDRTADDMAGSLTWVGLITDTLRIALAILGEGVLRLAKAFVVATDWQRRWGGLLGEQNEAVKQTIKTLDDMIESYADERTEVAKGYGVRQTRLEQEEEMRTAAVEHLQLLADLAGLTADMAKLTEELSDRENKLLGSLLERIDAEHKKTQELKLGEHWALRAAVADEDLNEITRNAAEILLMRIEANADWIRLQKEEEARIKALTAAFDKMFPSQKKIGEGIRSMSLGLDELNNRGFKPTQEQIQAQLEILNEWDEQIRNGTIKETKALREELDFLRVRLQVHNTEVQLATVNATNWADAIGELPPRVGELEKKLRAAFDTKTTQEFSEAIDQLAADFDVLNEAGDGMSKGMLEELQVRFLELSIEMFNAGEDSDEMKAKLEAASIVLGMGMPHSAAEAAEALTFFSDDVKKTGKKVETTFDKMWDKVTDGMGKAFGEMLFKAKTFREFLVDTFRGAAKLIIADSFGKLVSGFSAALSSIGTATDESGETIVTSFGDAMSNIGSMFTEFKGDTIGLMLGLGLAVFNILKGLFGKDGELKNVFADMKRLVGDISEELGEKIRELAKELGRAAAEAEFMGEIMDDVGVTIQNFSGFVEIARLSLHALNRGEIDAATATTQLDTNFGLLADQMETLGIVGDQSVIRLFHEIRDAGLEVASVIEFVDKNMRLAATGLETVVNGALINTQAELDRLGRLTAVVFNEMIANGSSFIEAMDAIGPALDGLIIAQDGSRRDAELHALAAAFLSTGEGSNEAAKAFLAAADAMGRVPEEGENAVEFAERLKLTLNEVALESGAALDELRRWRGLIEDNRAIVEAFDGLNNVMVGLANTGLLNQAVFDDLLLQAGKLALDLTAAGVSGKDAFILMAPFLDDLIEQAEKQGLTIDETTQKLIDQAEEYGVLGKGAKSEQDTMREGFDLVARAINRLITTLGGIPLALDEVGRDFDGLRDGAQRAFDDIAQTGRRAFEDLERASEDAARRMNRNFDDLEENLVGHTVFRNIQEKGSAFLEKLGETAADVSADMNFGDAEGRIPGVHATGPVPNFVVSVPTPSLAEGRRGLSKFEQQNLAILSRLVDAVVTSGGKGGGTNSIPALTSLRQTIGEVLREASLDGDAEIHVDSVGRLN